MKKKKGYILSILWDIFHGIPLKYIKIKIFITLGFHYKYSRYCVFYVGKF